jgi:P-type E1-E2 ATPase
MFHSGFLKAKIGLLYCTGTIPAAGEANRMDYNKPMIEVTIPGRAVLQLAHLVCDVNGTLAVDGQLLDGVAECILRLRDHLEIHLLTADTHGKQALIDQQLDLQAVRLAPGGEIAQKANFIRSLGSQQVAAIGQGANDAGMLAEAALGIAILSAEGVAVVTLLAADIVVPDILSGFHLLEKPLRIQATLRQ